MMDYKIIELDLKKIQANGAVVSRKKIAKLYRQEFTKKVEDYLEKQIGLKINYEKCPRDKNGNLKKIKDWFINVSHSGRYLAVVVSKEKEVGIDIERIENSELLKDGERRVRRVASCGEQKIRGNYLNNYVIKESYAKMLGLGLGIGFKRLDANKLLEKKECRFKNLSCDDYICYVCENKL